MTITVDNVTVRFGGVVALSNVSLKLEQGEIISVVGPNGSGKSTLFNAISGMVPLAGGGVSLNGDTIAHLEPSDRVSLGIARTFQTPRFDPQEDVRNATLSGFYPKVTSTLFHTLIGLPRWRREEAVLHQECDRILQDLKLLHLRNIRLGELSMGQVRLVEVARAIANKPRFLLLDEPAAGLTQAEQDALAFEIRRLSQRGIGVLLVEHNFSLVRQLAARVLVLNRGRPVLEGTPREIEGNEDFVNLYLGRTAKYKENAE